MTVTVQGPSVRRVLRSTPPTSRSQSEASLFLWLKFSSSRDSAKSYGVCARGRTGGGWGACRGRYPSIAAPPIRFPFRSKNGEYGKALVSRLASPAAISRLTDSARAKRFARQRHASSSSTRALSSRRLPASFDPTYGEVTPEWRRIICYATLEFRFLTIAYHVFPRKHTWQ